MTARFELLTGDYVETQDGVDFAHVLDSDLDLSAFCEAHYIDAADISAIGALGIGETHRIGSGAAARCAVRRVA